ncbi:MAG: hypothetical protein PHY93_08390 [Bacteriovorax sp.]|nr:hypothetical protein [Bacteriovorax sp.]
MNSNSILTKSGRNKSMSEAKVTKSIAKKSENIPVSVFLAMAAGAAALSIGLAMNRKRSWAIVVGQWIPSILLLGIYNKVANTQTLEKTDNQSLLH